MGMDGSALRTARMRDGAELSYRLIRGGGAGRCVLVHSLAMDAGFWNRVVPLLQSDCDVLVYDCRGHGRSSKPNEAYTIDLFSDDLADLLQAVGWERAAVCGASMGGCISIAFAANYPDKVEALGLFDTTAWYGENAAAAWEERARKAIDGGMAALVDFQKTRWFSDAFREANPDVLTACVETFLANDLTAYTHTCRMLGAVDKRDTLRRFTFPCTIVVGEEDYATPREMARAMQAAIPDAELHIIANARHFTPVEVPEIIAEHIAGLLQRRS